MKLRLLKKFIYFLKNIIKNYKKLQKIAWLYKYYIVIRIKNDNYKK